MPFKSVTWRFWAGAALCAGAYTGLGFWFANDGTVEMWLYRIGLTVATFVPLLFVGIYTLFGLSSASPAARWWRTSLGSSIVIAALSMVPLAAPLAWVFWFDNGVLTNTWLAWAEVSGPVVSALAWLRVSFIWLLVRSADMVLARAEPPAD